MAIFYLLHFFAADGVQGQRPLFALAMGMAQVRLQGFAPFLSWGTTIGCSIPEHISQLIKSSRIVIPGSPSHLAVGHLSVFNYLQAERANAVSRRSFQDLLLALQNQRSELKAGSNEAAFERAPDDSQPQHPHPP